ncbi:phosphonate ABC transporter ATP-binding protein [Deinococcus oregonensis]|uniref:Phosphonate ABC transporter ATP-binding protein n=1 Tax=Deinococcus oregonensis TaxID=1805970 RepID=A0ABV6AVR9_9DEIO
MVETRHLQVDYRGKRALHDVSMQFGSGFTAVIGPSGAGKSTLMRALNGLIPATLGQVLLDGQPLGRPGTTLLRMQQRQLGMVFQHFNLVRRLSALENVLLGCLGSSGALQGALGLSRRAEREWAMHLLNRVGLADHAWQRADQLSGGQQQRVGIARALAQRPRVILADEPISALDPRSSAEVMDILRDIQERDGLMVIANLHSLETVRACAGRVIALKGGRLVFDGHPAELGSELTRELYAQETAGVHVAGPAEVDPLVYT